MNSDTTSRTQPRNVHSSNKFMLERVEPPAYGPPPPPSSYSSRSTQNERVNTITKNLNNRFKR